MTKPCRQCNQAFEITDGDLAFYDKVSPVFAGKKEQIPPPTLCPDCRSRRRMAWRNERKLYWRKSDFSGKEILSVFSPDKPYKVYESTEWYSDKWDPKSFGRDFDFSRPFFPQFEELMKDIPQLALSVVNVENSDYINQAGWCRACYLIFEADDNDHCMYGNNINRCRYCIDCLMIVNCELCYECVHCRDCYNLKFSQDCETCSDSLFLKACVGCRNCFGCVNLVNREYCFLNEQLTKEQYLAKLASIDLSSYASLSKMRSQFNEFVKHFPHRAYHGSHNENSVGDYINHTKNCFECFDVKESQDCKFVVNSQRLKDVYDLTVFGGPKGIQLCYENHEAGEGLQRVHFSDQNWDGSHDLLYCKLCLFGSHDLFGCIGMNKAEYCILNKQYTKQEYETLMPRIIDHMRSTGEWGEFFPASISPFGYNETSAQEQWPVTREEALSQGFKWSDYIPPAPEGTSVAASSLPDRIAETTDGVLTSQVVCEVSNKPFRIIPQELKYNREQGLPIPHRHPDQRHLDRMALRNPRVLYDRSCATCLTAIKTTYAPERPERILCEDCYRKEVF